MSEERKSGGLSEVLSKLDKEFGKGTIMKLSEKPDMELEVISTGSLGLDKALGVGGLPKGRIVEIVGQESSGKAQPLTSKILTPYGWKYMKDMEIGSIISTPDGGDSTVIGIFPQGEQDVYEITFDDKSKARCTLDHLWFINTRGTKLGEVLTTKDLISRNIKSKHNTRKFKIPTVNPILFDSVEKLPINPYLMGLLLGDGGLTSGVKISSIDEEILDSIKFILKNEYIDMMLSNKQGNCNYTLRKIIRKHGKNELNLQLDSLGLMNKYSYEKHIPEIYLRASIPDRIALLQGLMDSDGTVDSGTLSYSSTSIKLSEDIVDLARGLGLRCSTSSRITKYTNSTNAKVDGRISYRTTMLINTLEFNPFRLSRKLSKFKINKGEYSERFIEDIKLVGKEQCQCIAIGHPDKLYITDDYIVTHNTTLAMHIIAEAQKKNNVCAFIDAEHAYSLEYSKNIGVDTDKLYISQPDYGEACLEICEKLISSGEVDVIVIDSVAALTPLKEIEGAMGDASMGLQARMMSQALRKLVATTARNNTLLIFINQYREKIGVMFGDTKIPTGGNSLKFYASIRLDISRSTTEANSVKEGEEKIGNLTKIRVLKNKVAAPFRTCEFDILYGHGIWKEKEVIELAVNVDIIQKSGSWYSYKGAKVAQGLNAFTEILRDNEALMNEIIDKIKNK